MYIEADYDAETYQIVTLWLFLVVPYFLLGLSMCAVVGIERAKRRLLEKVGVQSAADLDRALLASRAKTGNSNTSTNNIDRRSSRSGGRLNKRASIIAPINQQEALNAYLPLLINGLFPYNKPELFPKSLEVVMLTQCFFIGLACIFHIRQAFDTFSIGVAICYIIFTMLPHLIVLLMIAPHVMTSYVFVHSVGYVNKEVLEHVNEFMEETDELKLEIKTHLQSYLLSAQPPLTLADLFLKLTKGGSVIMSHNLRSALESVNVQLTASQTNRLIRMINLGQNGAIDLREFSLFFFGSEGSGALSLVPIRANTTAQLLRISATGRDEIMEKEIAKEREKVAEQERIANIINDGVVVVEVDGEPSIHTTDNNNNSSDDGGHGGTFAVMDRSAAAVGGDVITGGKRAVDFHPNALHDPDSPHPAPAIHHISAVLHSTHTGSHGQTPTSPHSLASPHHGSNTGGHNGPMLDLRGAGGKTHGDANIFISSTLDHTTHHHHHPHAKSQPPTIQSSGSGGSGKLAIGRHDVDALDFAACFHGSETVCQRCGHVVLVKQINTHVQQCRIRHEANTRSAAARGGIDLTVDLSRLRSGTTLPHVDEEGGADGSGGGDHIAGVGVKPVSAAVVSNVTMDDIVLNDSKGGSKRSTRASGRQLPLVVGADGKVELKLPVAAAVVAGGAVGERERGLVLDDGGGSGRRSGSRMLQGRAESRRRQSLTDIVPRQC